MTGPESESGGYYYLYFLTEALKLKAPLRLLNIHHHPQGVKVTVEGNGGAKSIGYFVDGRLVDTRPSHLATNELPPDNAW